MEFTVRVPGSCGELIQGRAGGEPFLVTCPIGCYTTVRVSDCFHGIEGLGRKSLLAMERTLRKFGKEEFPWGLRLESELPRGKGMASSSADIAATIAAVSLAFASLPHPAEILRLAANIEPTDGVFCPDVVRLNHITGQILASYKGLPAFRISVYDTGGEVDTICYHERTDERLRKQDSAEELALFEQGCRGKDAALIAQAATLSARNNQKLLPKEKLEELLDFACTQGALGVNVAHSGTVIGVLWPEDFPDWKLVQAESAVRQHFPSLTLLTRTRLRGGGIEVAGESGDYVELFNHDNQQEERA